MLTKPTLAQLRAASRLAPQPDWRELMSLVDVELAEIFLRMTDSHNTVVLHQLQGRAQALKDFRKLVGESQVLLERMTK
jgi:hypothetical protein